LSEDVLYDEFGVPRMIDSVADRGHPRDSTSATASPTHWLARPITRCSSTARTSDIPTCYPPLVRERAARDAMWPE